MSADRLIPVGVLTGFLGAGKTTLLNRILSQPNSESGSRKFGVIINELGRIGIDPKLVTYSEEDVVELSNGCICCSVRVDLAKTVRQLIQRGGADYVLIETTGIAEPAPIIQTFQNIPEIRKIAQIDAIITVVDAEHVLGQLEQTETARNQIALADFVILNKMDLSTPENRERVEAKIRELNPMTQVIPATLGDVDWRLFLDVGAFDVAQKIAVDPQLLDELRKLEHTDIQSLSFHFERPLDLSSFERCIADLSENDRIYRSKGIVHVAGHSRRAIFHGVNNRFTIVWGTAWGLRETRTSDMVFIGKDLVESRIHNQLTQCLAAE